VAINEIFVAMQMRDINMYTKPPKQKP